MGAVPVAETEKIALAPGDKNSFAGWVVMTGWAKALFVAARKIPATRRFSFVFIMWIESVLGSYY
jgi:hypothetical protein